MNKFKIWKTIKYKERDLDLVVVSVRELGFTKHMTPNKILAKAQKLGLRLCPLGIGDCLTLLNEDIPHTFLNIGMKPIFKSHIHTLVSTGFGRLAMWSTLVTPANAGKVRCGQLDNEWLFIN